MNCTWHSPDNPPQNEKDILVLVERIRQNMASVRERKKYLKK